LRLTNLLRDGVQPFLFGVEMQVISHEAGPVLVVRVPRSLTAPHMITARDYRRFFVRTSNGTAPMDVNELRAAFLGGQEFEQRVDAFRRQRLMKLIAGQGPLPEMGGRLLVLHSIPLASSTRVDMTKRDLDREMRPLTTSNGWNGRHNLDGYLTFPLGKMSYAQLFRNHASPTAYRTALAKATLHRKLELAYAAVATACH
jgi:hypothetical protein